MEQAGLAGRPVPETQRGPGVRSSSRRPVGPLRCMDPGLAGASMRPSSERAVAGVQVPSLLVRTSGVIFTPTVVAKENARRRISMFIQN